MFFVLLLLAFLPIPSEAHVLETASFAEIDPLLEKASSSCIIFCDIDNTLIQSQLHLGSASWGEGIIASLLEKGFNKADALAIEALLWKYVQMLVPIQAVDSEAPFYLSKWQAKNIPIIGLTARYPEETETTNRQLISVGIELTQFFLPDDVCNYSNGVIFCGMHQTKAEVLLNFLDKTNLQADLVIFIDDKGTHVSEVDAALQARGIASIGIRFSGADSAVAAYDPQLAEIQWKHLPQLLSDEQARQILSEKKCLSLN